MWNFIESVVEVAAGIAVADAVMNKDSTVRKAAVEVKDATVAAAKWAALKTKRTGVAV